jgi:Ankyrin repeats (many copies)
VAALQGYTECLELLLKHAADLTVPGDAGLTLLHAAAHNGRVQCLALLLSYCSDSGTACSIDAVSALGDSALSLLCSQALEVKLAVKSKESSNKAACAQLLLEAGASATPAVIAALAASEAAQLQENDSEADDRDGSAAGARFISDYIASLRSSRAADCSLLAVHAAAACSDHAHSTGSAIQHTAECSADVSQTDTVTLRLVHAVTGAAAAEYTLDVRTLKRLLALTEDSDGAVLAY